MPVTQAEEGLTPGERFKAFVESPPPIRSVVYRVKKSGAFALRAGKAKYEGGKVIFQTEAVGQTEYAEWGADPRGFRYYLARWQPDACAHWQLEIGPELGGYAKDASNANERDEAVPNSRLVSSGRYESYMWLIMSGRLQLRTNSVSTVTAPPTLSDLLSMGIKGVDPGAIEWSGNTFSHSKKLLGHDIQPEVLLRGELTMGPDGRARRLDIRRTGESGSAMARVVYEYKRDIGVDYLPSHISVVHDVDTETAPLRFEIFSMTMTDANERFDRSFFEHEAAPPEVSAWRAVLHPYTEVDVRFVYNEKNQLMKVDQDGEGATPVEGVSRIELVKREGEQKSEARLLSLVIVGLVFAPAIVIVMWARRRKRSA